METGSSLPPPLIKPQSKKKNTTIFIPTLCDQQILALVEREQTTVMDVVTALIESPRSYLYKRVALLEHAGLLTLWKPHPHAEQFLLPVQGRIPRKPWHRRNTAIRSACVQLATRHLSNVRFLESDIWEFPSKPKPIRPDTLFFLDFPPDENGDTERQAYSLEDDEDTESIEDFTYKCSKYWHFYDQYIFQPQKEAERQGIDWTGNAFDIDSLRILITVPHEQRLKRLLEAACRAVAKASNGATRGLGAYWAKVRPFTNMERKTRQQALANPDWVVDGWRTPVDDKLHSILE